MKKTTIIIALTLLIAAVSFGQERYVKPVDEASKDASFLAFRTKLIAAVKKKDAKYILAIVDKNIKNSFGGNDGIAEFKEAWDLEKANTNFWQVFSEVINNGGHFVKEGNSTTKTFWAPYSFNGFPEDLDAFEHSVVFGSGVNLRQGPSTDSKVVASLSYNIVTVNRGDEVIHDHNGENQTWNGVQTLGGKKGFIRSDFLRSPIDHRAGFEKIKGQWKLVIFIAGD